MPNTRKDLIAIASAILTFQQKQGSTVIATHHIFKRFQAIAIFAIIEMCEFYIVLCPKI